MMSCVVNQSGILESDAFDVVDDLLVDRRVGPGFVLMVLWSCFSSLFSRGLGTKVVWVILGSLQ